MDPPLETSLQGSQELESAVTSNDLLLENIIRYMATKDLLSSSLVNPRWLHFSRKELQKRKCLAFVNGREYPSCFGLYELNSFFKSNPTETNFPFTGLRIDYEYHRDQERFREYCIKNYNLDHNFSALLSKCPIKYLRVNIRQFPDCPTMDFIKLLFQTRRHEIEHLEISEYVRYATYDGFTHFLGIADDPAKTWLPNLKVLVLHSDVIKAALIEILNGAPNLKEIWGHIRPHLTPVLVGAGKMGLIREIKLDPETAQGLQTCLEFSGQDSKLKSLYVSSKKLKVLWGSQMEWLKILAVIMKSSLSSLQELEIEHIDLLLLSTREFLPLFNLRRLTLKYNPELDKHLNYFSLQFIDFKKLFPALETVVIRSKVIYFGPHCSSSVENRAIEALVCRISRRESCSSGSVRSLELIDTSFNKSWPDHMQGITDLFPSITSVNFGETPDVNLNLRFLLGSNWPLESIALISPNTMSQQELKALNALLCGIFPQELPRLAKLSSVSLQEFNLVPLEHSLLNLKSLMTLKLVVKDVGRSPAPKEPTGSPLISQVTRTLILSKMSGLNVFIR